MILYFDNLITDVPLVPGYYSELDQLRDSSPIYKMPDKLSITLYTLASYAELDWSEVVIKYELGEDFDTPQNREKFEQFVLKLFPRVHLIYGRSDNQRKFQETIELINGFDDEWIFYAGNNDHPFVAPDNSTLNSCLAKARDLKKKHMYVSIYYSHFTEALNMVRGGNPIHSIHLHNSKILEETEDYVVALLPRGKTTAIQIVHRDLLNHWFFSRDLGSLVVKRSEDVGRFVTTRNQVCVIPKKEIAAHFDGYSHTQRWGHLISSDLVPPLFIPNGFFEKNIKISYGYDKYRAGWVNVNPLKEKYSFRDAINGTDLMIAREDIPLFWKKRIKKLDVNKKLDGEKMQSAIDKKYNQIANPHFPEKSKFYYFLFRAKRNLRYYTLGLGFLPKPIFIWLRKSKILVNFYRSLVK